MHKFILGVFNFLKNLVYLFKLFFIFSTMMLTFYWIQNIIKADWSWLNFIKPFLDGLLNVANSIYSISFTFFGATLEFKYLSAVIILIGLVFLMNLITMGICMLEGLYKSGHFLCKKVEEAAMNKSLQDDMTKIQKQISKYSIVVTTYPKEQNAYSKLAVDMDEQNRIMNKFLMGELNVNPSRLGEGFVYNFNDFEKIDYALDVFFRVLNSKAPVNYSINVQISTNNPVRDKELMEKLVKLKVLGKISMGSDTAYRYEYNQIRRYDTCQIGLFSDGAGTLEMHEFKSSL